MGRYAVGGGTDGVPVIFSLIRFLPLLFLGGYHEKFAKNYFLFLKRRWDKVALPYYCSIIMLLLYILFAAIFDIPSVLIQPIQLPGILCLGLLINGVMPQYYNYLFLGSWYIGTLFVLYCAFPFLFEKARYFSLKKLKISLWGVGSFPVLISLIDFYILGVEKHLINSFWYCSALNQLPVFYMGIVLYCECRNMEEIKRKKHMEIICKMFFWLILFGVFFWLREILIFSASVVCFAFGRACYWLWIWCCNYLRGVEKRISFIKKLCIVLGKYGEVSFFAYLIHWFFVRDLLYWIVPLNLFEPTIMYLACLICIWILIYFAASFFGKCCDWKKKRGVICGNK